MSTKTVNVGQITKGSYVMADGVPCKCVDVQISKSGKHGHAKARITAIGILDDKKRVIVAPSHDNIDVPIVEKKNASVLSVTGTMANVMDSESFETFDLAIPEEIAGQIVEGVQITYWIVMGDRVMKQLKAKE